MLRSIALVSTLLAPVLAASSSRAADPPAAAPAPASAAPAKAAPGKLEVTWWGHAAWIVKTPGGAVIAIDPWLKNPSAPKDQKWPEKLDAILVTHAHFDHLGDAVELANKTGAQLIGSFELVSQLGVKTATGANPGGSFVVKDATIRLVEAVHSSGFGDPSKPPVSYGGAPMGFVIAIDKGPVLYHAGDTDAFSSMALIGQRYKPTIAMLPIGGLFTMDPDGAAVAAKLLGVKTILPMHFGTFPQLTGTPEQLVAALKKQKVTTAVVALKPGESKTF